MAVVLAHLVLVESQALVARRLEGRVGQQQPAVLNPPNQSRSKFDLFHPGLLFSPETMLRETPSRVYWVAG